MTTKWSEIKRTKVPPEQEAAQAASSRALRDALSLSGLRNDRGVTQVQIASKLRKTQGSVSALERRQDIYLSSLKEYVAALGGRLELTAVFGDDRMPLKIGGPSPIAEANVLSQGSAFEDVLGPVDASNILEQTKH